jgi:voltage-gated potassium channel Kch
VPELMLVLSLGWCFLVGIIAAHPRVGLSMEMGALIAGVALATFPYNLDVNAKVLNIRDFFITLFFVSLGMRIPAPATDVLLAAGAVAGVLWISRLVGVFGLLHVLRAGHWTSILPTINLAQMSEFSLVILALGVTYGHVGGDTLTVAIWTFAILAVASTYQIAWSHRIERWMSRLLERIGLRDLRTPSREIRRAGDRPIVVLGFYRIAGEFLHDVARSAQHLLEQIKVVDFSPEVASRLAASGVPVIYGDIGNPETLIHAKVEDARVVISSVPDGALRGTSNGKLLKVLKELSPKARIILTAETPEQARALYRGGADYVLQPSALAGAALLTAVDQAMHGSCEGLREEAESDLDAHSALGVALSPAQGDSPPSAT